MLSERDLDWLVSAFEGLLQAGACFDCMVYNGELEPNTDSELIEAIGVDCSRAYSALQRVLAKYDRVPTWCRTENLPTDTLATPRSDEDIPF